MSPLTSMCEWGYATCTDIYTHVYVLRTRLEKQIGRQERRGKSKKKLFEYVGIEVFLLIWFCIFMLYVGVVCVHVCSHIWGGGRSCVCFSSHRSPKLMWNVLLDSFLPYVLRFGSLAKPGQSHYRYCSGIPYLHLSCRSSCFYLASRNINSGTDEPSPFSQGSKPWLSYTLL